MISEEEFGKKSSERKVNHSMNRSFTISFQMTGECNFRCSYCYENKHKEVLDINSAYKLLDRLFPIEKNLVWWNGFFHGYLPTTIGFDFFGGECTLEIDNIEKICQYFYEKSLENNSLYLDKWKIGLQTNGSLLTTPKVLAFLTKWSKIIGEENISLGITIDGTKKFHDACRVFKGTGKPTWSIVKRNYLKIQEMFPRMELGSKSTITHDSISEIYESYLFFKNTLKLQTIQMHPGLDCTWEADDYKKFIEQYDLVINDMLNDPHPPVVAGVMNQYLRDEDVVRDYELYYPASCGSNGDSIALSSDNKLYTCVQFSHITQDKRDSSDFVIGDVDQGIYDRCLDIHKMLKDSFNGARFTKDKCKRCAVGNKCEFCPAFNFKDTGDINDSSAVVNNENYCKIKKAYAFISLKYSYLLEKKKCQAQYELI